MTSIILGDHKNNNDNDNDGGISMDSSTNNLNNNYNSNSNNDIDNNKTIIKNNNKNTLDKKDSFFLKYIKHHYREQTLQRTEKQIENEKYLFFGLVPFSRWVLFPCAFLVQFCIGSFYGWSIFNKPIDSYIFDDPKKGMAPITYYITMAVYGVSLLFVGPWLERHGPRKGILVGGTFFSVGQFLAAVGIHTKQIAVVYVGYGLFCGIGNAFTYLAPVSSLQKWFPDHRGLASGFAVCGLSAGTIVFSQILLPMINHINLVNTFIALGCIFLTVFIIQAYFFRNPPPGYKPPAPKTRVVRSRSLTHSRIPRQISDQDQETRHLSDPDLSKMSIIDAITSKEFRLMYVMFFANGVSSNIISSRLSNMVQDLFAKDAKTAAMVVTVNGAFNLVGRLAFGFASEKIGRKQSFNVILTMMVLIFWILTRVITEHSYGGFVALIWLYSLAYGGGFGTVPAFLTDLFGPKNISPCHALILTAWNLAGVGGGFLFTGIYDALRRKGHTVDEPILYNANFYWLVSVIMIGWVVSFFIPVKIKERLYPAVPNQIFQTSLYGKILRIVRKKDGGNPFEIVSAEKEKEEWNEFLIQYHEKLLEENENNNNNTPAITTDSN
ncbi:hypothetical protein CYY_007287 [Polysphondylium violaceum]|uniref:Major facilitator superfamily (MFS) profile domain-containing protein n=1 Tax=Polysphondylium violaceum TaxID=133409 RepID=A0A8J4PPW8_9MYCE|nr:hypothetical protein CYY_007287 [Polysphondylium violaceum]